jgi:hypothetical protein
MGWCGEEELSFTYWQDLLKEKDVQLTTALQQRKTPNQV